MSTQRLQKILADAGLASRRGAVELIAAGRVSVNGATVFEPGCRADALTDQIALDGVPLPRPQEKCTYLIDKPRGVICSSRDPQGRPTVVQWAHAHGVPANLRLFSVGRLDFDSEGLLLLTTDGDLANRLSHPSHHVEKEYLVWTRRELPGTQMQSLLDGILDSGELLRALSVRRGPDRNTLRIVLGEGRNRQIRRMLSALSCPVRRLRRIRIGSLTEADLKNHPLRLLPSPLIARLFPLPFPAP